MFEAGFTRDHQLIEKIGGVTVASRGTARMWPERVLAGGFGRSPFSAEYEA